MEITSPLTSQPIGVGMFVKYDTDFVGPIPVGAWVEAHLLPAVGERDLAIGKLFTQNPVGELVLGEFQDAAGSAFTTLVLPQEAFASHGSDARLSVSLHDPAGVVLDQTTVNVKMDALTGLQWIRGQAGSVQGGFTAADRAQLEEVHMASFSALPLTNAIGDLVDVALSSQFTCPPGPLLVPALHGLLTGAGTVTRPSGSTGVYAYGFTFRFEVVPPGLSVIDGRALEYPERMAQFLVIKVDSAGNEYVSDRYDFHHDQERVCWGIPFPKRIEYSVLPGVSMRFFWLLFPVGQ